MHIRMLIYVGITLYRTVSPLKMVCDKVVFSCPNYIYYRYVQELLCSVTDTRIGCNVGDIMMNILAYADDIALLAPSWAAMRELFAVLVAKTIDVGMVCNTDKTECMVFKPSCKSRIVLQDFPCFMLLNQSVKFVAVSLS